MIFKTALPLFFSILALALAAMAIPLRTNFTQVHIDQKPQGGTATPRLLVDTLNGPSDAAIFLIDGTPVVRIPNDGGLDLYTGDLDIDNAVGKLNWNDVDGTLEFGALGGEVVLQIGQESHIRGTNKSGVTINNGEAVTIVGAQGSKTKFDLSDADNPPLVDSVAGLATENIANNGTGYVTTFGLVRELNTSAFSEGDRVWATNTPGQISNIPPPAPSRKVFVGTVVVSNPSNGSIFVSPVNVPNLSALSDVFITSIADQDALWWDTDDSRWENTPLPNFATQTSITVTNATAFTATGRYQPITAAGEVTPMITAGADGDELILINTSAQTIHIEDAGTMKLNISVALGQFDTLHLWSDGTNWIQVSHSDN